MMEENSILHIFGTAKNLLGDSMLLQKTRATTRRRFWLMSPTVLGYGFLAVLAFAAIFGPHFARFSPADINVGPRLSPPDQVYYFGTDALGRDLFSRVVYGLRISLWISLMATLIAAFPGIVLGMISGYYRGWTDQIFSRGIDVLLALPGLLLAIVLIARLGPSMTTLILAMGITAIPTFYRVARNETMSLSTHLFIEAGRSIGLTDFQLIFRYILPNINSALLALISMRLGIFLLMGSGLSFIGLGVRPPQVELGALLASGKEYFQTAKWLITFPGLAIVFTVLGLNLVGEGLRDRLDL